MVAKRFYRGGKVAILIIAIVVAVGGAVAFIVGEQVVRSAKQDKVITQDMTPSKELQQDNSPLARIALSKWQVEVPFDTAEAARMYHARYQADSGRFSYEITATIGECQAVIGKIVRDSGAPDATITYNEHTYGFMQNGAVSCDAGAEQKAQRDFELQLPKLRSMN